MQTAPAPALNFDISKWSEQDREAFHTATGGKKTAFVHYQTQERKCVYIHRLAAENPDEKFIWREGNIDAYMALGSPDAASGKTIWRNTKGADTLVVTIDGEYQKIFTRKSKTFASLVQSDQYSRYRLLFCKNPTLKQEIKEIGQVVINKLQQKS